MLVGLAAITALVQLQPAVLAADDEEKGHTYGHATFTYRVSCTAEVDTNDGEGSGQDTLTIKFTETQECKLDRFPNSPKFATYLESWKSTVSVSGRGKYVPNDPEIQPSIWHYETGKQFEDRVCSWLNGTFTAEDFDWDASIVGPEGVIPLALLAVKIVGEQGAGGGSPAVSSAGLAFLEGNCGSTEEMKVNVILRKQPAPLEWWFALPEDLSKPITCTAHKTYTGGTDLSPGDTGSTTITVDYNFHFVPPSPSNVDAVIKVIKPKGDYKGWQPWASTKQGQAGNSIAFDVELKDKKTGEPPGDKTAWFEFTLLDTTQEPGSCMNSPWADAEPDLKILKANNTQLASVGGDGQSAKSRDGLTSSPITVSCFDGGARGRLEVVAHLDDDTEVTAHMAEDGTTDVSLPYDVDGNRIADAWEQQNDVVGKDEASDDDDQPQGNFFNGDGLTLWEEYRGFLQEGKHIRTDPHKKDLFICDTMGGRVKAAIARFEALTKIAVHARLTRDELSDWRVINRNHAEGPHVVDQHGLLTWPSTGTGSCEAVGGPGTPKTCREVRLDTAIANTQQGRGSGAAKTYPLFVPCVVHELLHCCNVWHHGESDEHGQVWWRANAVDGKTSIYEYADAEDVGHTDRGQAVTVLDESTGKAFLPTDEYWRTAHYVWLGMHQGQHSGYEDCVMRYCCSDAYGSGLVRYYLQWFGWEPVGQNICTSPAGTGVNAPDRKPKSRYGDADEENRRGNCTDQICVNDRYEPYGPGGP